VLAKNNNTTRFFFYRVNAKYPAPPANAPEISINGMYVKNTYIPVPPAHTPTDEENNAAAIKYKVMIINNTHIIANAILTQVKSFFNSFTCSTAFFAVSFIS